MSLLTLVQAKKLKPMNNNILVELLQNKERESSKGLVIPSGDKDPFFIGKVIAVGPGLVNDKGEVVHIKDIKENDYVCFNQYSGTKIDVQEFGKEYKFVIIKNVDILALTDCSAK